MSFFNRTEWRVLYRVLGLFITITITCLIMIKGWYVYLVLAIPVIIAQLVDFYKLQRKAHDELGQFVESVHYRDFSRYFDVKQAPVDLQPLRKGFNEINTTIKDISRERETQYQYLQKILELIDTGILMYREDDGTVVWMNEALKNMLQLPYLKTIHSLNRRDADLYLQVTALKPGESKIGTAHLERRQVQAHRFSECE
jgi:signal transduction histidine kinase